MCMFAVVTCRYYSGDLTTAGRTVVADLGPASLRATFATTGARDDVDINIWLGSANATATPHVDAEHNVFVQLAGRKAFTLLPPGAWRALGVHSRLHPCWRQARTVDALSSGAPRAVVTLSPGDVLYVPPYVFHGVTAVDASASVNLWTPGAAGAAADALATARTPFDAGWPPELTAAVAVRYLRALLVRGWGAGRDAAAGFLRDLVAARYTGSRDAPPVVADDEAEEAAYGLCGSGGGGRGGAALRASVTAAVNAAVAALAPLCAVDADAAALVAGDHVEDVAAYAVGPRLARTFVERCLLARGGG
jgi:hypothetical protein